MQLKVQPSCSKSILHYLTYLKFNVMLHFFKWSDFLNNTFPSLPARALQQESKSNNKQEASLLLLCLPTVPCILVQPY